VSLFRATYVSSDVCVEDHFWVHPDQSIRSKVTAHARRLPRQENGPILRGAWKVGPCDGRGIFDNGGTFDQVFERLRGLERRKVGKPITGYQMHVGELHSASAAVLMREEAAEAHNLVWHQRTRVAGIEILIHSVHDEWQDATMILRRKRAADAL
jgi:hypothetical protein